MKKRNKILGYIIGFLVLLIFGANLLLMSSAFTATFSELASNYINGDIKAESISLNIFTGKLSIDDLSITDIYDEELIEIGKLSVNIELNDLLKKRITIQDFELDDAFIDIVQNNDETINLTKLAKTENKGDTNIEKKQLALPHIIFENLEISNFNTYFYTQNKRYALKTANFKSKFSLPQKSGFLKIFQTKISLLENEQEIELDFDLHADIKNENLNVDYLNLKTGKNTLQLKGEIFDTFQKPQFDITSEAKIDSDFSENFLPNKNINLNVNYNLKISGDLNSPKIEMKLNTPDSQFEEIGFSTSSSIFLQDKNLKINNQIELTAQDLISININADLTDVYNYPKFDINKLVADLDITANNLHLANFLQSSNQPLTGNLASQINMNINTLKKVNLTGKAVGKSLLFRNARLNPEFNFSAAIKDSIIFLDSLKIEDKSATIKAKGFYAISEKKSKGSAEINISNLSDFTDLATIEDLAGVLQSNLNFRTHNRDVYGTLSTQIDSLQIAGNEVAQIAINGEINKDSITVDDTYILINENDKIELSANLSKFKNYNFRASSTPLQFRNIAAIPDSIDGQLVLDFSGSGELSNPQISGNINLSQLQYLDLQLPNANIDLHLNQQKLLSDIAVDSLLNSQITLNTKSMDYSTKMNIATEIDNYLNDNKLKSIFLANLIANGNLNNLTNSSAKFEIDKLNLFYNDTEYIKQTKLLLTKNQDNLHLNLDSELANGSYIKAQSESKINNPEISLKSYIDLGIIADFTKEYFDELQGNIEIEGNISQNNKQLEYESTIKLNNIEGRSQQYFLDFSNLNGVFNLNNKIVTIDSLSTKINNGFLTLNGSINQFSNENRNFDFSLNTNAVDVNIPEQIDLRLSSNLLAKGNMNRIDISGDVDILQGLYSKEIELNIFDMLTNKKRSYSTSDLSKKSAENLLMDKIKFAINLNSKSNIIIDNNLLYSEINPNLKLIGSAYSPILEGIVNLNNGKIFIRDREFALKKGEIVFSNPHKIDPNFSFEAEAQIDKYQLQLSLQKQDENLDVAMSSLPYLNKGNILSLILTGRTLSDISGSENGKFDPKGFMLEYASKKFSSNIKNTLGLDIFEFNSNGLDDNKLNVGKKLSDRLRLIHTLENSNGATEQKTTVEYQLRNNLQFNNYRLSNGNIGSEFQLKYRFRW